METGTGYSFVRRNRTGLKILGAVATFLGVGCAIVGIIADASRTYLIGLTYLSWLYLAIATLIFAVICWIGWAVAVYLNSREPAGTEPENTESESTESENPK